MEEKILQSILMKLNEMHGDIVELKDDMKVLKEDVIILKSDVKHLDEKIDSLSEGVGEAMTRITENTDKEIIKLKILK